MAVPLLTAKIVKKRTKHFKRAHSDRYIGLKVRETSSANCVVVETALAA
jgi:ribosomal protein L32E